MIHESTPIQPLGDYGHRDTLVLTFRRGETARFEGRFAEYDNILHQVWLDGCKQARRR